MPTPERLAELFEGHRSDARAVAYRMLGSINEAEDAVQEALEAEARLADSVGLAPLVVLEKLEVASGNLARDGRERRLNSSSDVRLVNRRSTRSRAEAWCAAPSHVRGSEQVDFVASIGTTVCHELVDSAARPA